MKKHFWNNGTRSYTKLLLCLLIGAIGMFVRIPAFSDMQHVLFSWDIFCFIYLTVYWISFYTTPTSQILVEAKREDNSRTILFTLVMIIVFVSLLGVFMLIISTNVPHQSKYIPISLTLFTLFLSWNMLHTVYTVRYAHLYYDNEQNLPDGGLQFPGDEKQPDFLDFAYYSFTLGMTFQVSDISITSKKIRRLTLWHSLISFGYNMVIIAITINIIAGLGG